MRFSWFVIPLVLPGLAAASPLAIESALRPMARAAYTTVADPAVQSAVTTASLALVRPTLRPAVRQARAPAQVILVQSTANAGFNRWIAGFRSRAAAQGITSATLDAAFAGVQYNSNVIQHDRNQSEFNKTLWEYLDSAASETRIANGRDALRQNAPLLERIEATYGVDKAVVVAIWGLESAYGTFRGEMPLIESLATLAYDGRRGPFFEGQLIAALKILQHGDVAPRNMTGSWAGAMGHTQFIPTSYLAYAVDFTGDGRRDIWADDPSDALASTAAYLASFGWVRGQPWGVEVQLPPGFDYAMADRNIKRMPSQWAQLGVVGIDGQPVSDYGTASVLVPAGSQGAAFLIFKNFDVIERYNTADSYIIGVGHLSDRIKGGGPIHANWPRGDRALLFVERQEIQQRLTAAGFDTGGIDGRIGPNTIAAIRGYQRSAGLTPDGYASPDLLTRLRR
jgi:membrane-bound lytic murein transglycosylase B